MSNLSFFIILWLSSGLFLSIFAAYVNGGFKEIYAYRTKEFYLTLISSLFGLLLIFIMYYILIIDFVREREIENYKK